MSALAEARLDDWKRKLIDLSRRNRLIHFRSSRGGAVRVVGELAPEIFRMTVLKRVAMTLMPRPEDDEEARKAGVDASSSEYEAYTADDLLAHQIDRALQTDLDAERLEKTLLKVYRKARSIEEEHGYNTLYLALGFLEWYESTDSDELFESPLLLVPVELTRRQAGGRFYLRSRDEDPVLNPALDERLRRDFSIDLPLLPDELEETDPRELFNAISLVTRELKRARMTNSILLGLFSFTKFAMYKDLETHGATFAPRPLVACLAGDAEARQQLPEVALPAPEELDDLDPTTTYRIMDSDSSQQEAIEAAKRGANLVIEGPPGTGKSQTIANIIAECLLQGKSVLFVSEKMAALEVVQRRLESCGLGDFCLELHSHKTSRRSVIGELRRVLELPRRKSKVKNEFIERLASVRADLNRYARELREPVPPLGMSPYAAHGRVAGLGDVPEVPVYLRGASEWDPERYERNLESIRRLGRALDRVRPLEEHAWRGCRLREVSYEEKLDIRREIDEVLAAHAALDRLAGDLAGDLETRPAGKVEDVRDLLDLADVLARSPRPDRAHIESAAGGAWETLEPELRRIIDLGREHERARERVLAIFEEVVLEADVAPVRIWFERRGASLLRFFRPTFWRYRRQLRTWRRPDHRATDVITELGEVESVQALARELSDHDAGILADAWRGLESDWNELEARAEWFRRLHDHGAKGLLSERVLDLAANGYSGGDLPDRVAEALTCWTTVWDRLARRLDFDGPDLPLEELRGRIEGMRDAPDTLDEWARYQSALAAARHPDTAEFTGPALEALPGEAFDAAFQRQFYRSWIEEILPRRPALRDFDGRHHDELVATFRELDQKIVELNRVRARAVLLDRLPDGNWDATAGSDLGLLQREVRKKRGHVPLRRLFASVPRSLRRLKPCMMMSPLSVAQFLDPTAEPFDVVVFDEASQIAPEDAIGAIARARQLVVVGDSKQLPPTAFFRVEAPDPLEEELGQGELESILDECVSAFPDRRLLRWHYRSRHEALITFSNRVYYGGQLYSFPSPDQEGGERGVRFVHVPDGVYDRGGTGKNEIEAERVARAVFEQLRSSPEKSVGVGAFSVRQQEAIEDALEALRREDPSLEERFDYAHPEYCFVKNLETIQGDERDVIFLSIGYGRDAAGKMSMNFGPLNQQGGARRLNVLVTRAREAIHVFSSIRAEDIDLGRTSAEGAKNLRRYLEYAARGPGMLPDAGEDPGETEDFEGAVERALAGEGIEVDRQLGCSGYRVDIAVRQSGAHVLGIECDGPGYQFAPTARDRDRLRAQVLRGLGWRLHRIWSVDWFRSPRREIERMLAAVERARRGEPHAVPAATPADELDDAVVDVPESESEDIRPYELFEVPEKGAADEFYRERIDRIVRVLRNVVNVEGPIHRDEAARRVISAWKITRLTPKAQEILDSALGRCVRSGLARVRGEFLWPRDMSEPPVRCRARDAPREAELIAPEEIAAAVVLILRKEYRVREEELIDRTARILGYSRTGPRVRECVERAVDLLRDRRAVVLDDGEYRLAPSGGEGDAPEPGSAAEP